MSKKPYVIQEDSPNLVIVPTVNCYELSPKKRKLENTSSTTKVPEIIQASERSALVNNAGAKVKPRVSSVNENVLIDVSRVKKQPNSWATNFLQSIGGSASKLPRAYNWHSTASKPAFQRNENIQSINYLPIVHPEINTNTTQSNASKEIIQLKSIKKLTLTKTHTNASQPKINNDFSLSNGTNEHVTIQSKTQCSQPKPNKEPYPSNDSKARYLQTVNKDSSHLKSNKEATLKTEKEASQPKPPTKGVTHLKNRNELIHLMSDSKKNTQTKVIIKKKCQEEATKLRGKSETCRTKAHDKTSDTNVHKEKLKSKILKEITEKKTSKTQTSVANRENNSLKKIKVDEKKSKESDNDKNKKSKEVDGKNLKRESSKSKKITSPIRSVVKKIKYHTSGDPKHSDEYELNHNSLQIKKMSKDSDVDLRAKLKRRVSKNDRYNQESREKRKCNKIFPTMPNEKGFVPDENLIISFDAENGKDEVGEKIQPVKTKKSGGHKCKKIKLEINIVFQKDDISDEESPKCGVKEDYENNNDLSFLDDFNVDEIAESLNDCQSNIVKIGNLTNINEHIRTSKIDFHLPITIDNNPAINNYESISKDEIIIENSTTNASSLTLCNEKSPIKTENKSKELIRLTDHNGVAKHNNDNSESKSKNIILEPQREAGSVKGKTDKLSNAIGEIKAEFVANDAICNENVIYAKCSRDLSATNSNNMEKLSESVTVPGVRQLKTDNILTRTEIKSEEVHNSMPSMQMDTKNTNKLQKENTESDKTTNIDSDKNLENLAADQNITLPSDINNKGKNRSDKNPTTTVHSMKIETVEASIFVDKIKHEDEVILVEDSDDDCDNNIAKVQGAQNQIEHNIVDLTLQKGCSFDTKPKEVITIDAIKPKTNETDSKSILILDTDYEELKDDDYLKNKKGVAMTGRIPEPIDVIKKHLFCNNDNKTQASDKIPEKSETSTVFNHKTNNETKNNQCKTKKTVTVISNTRQNKSDDGKIKNSTAKNITPSVKNKKDAATNKGRDTHNITPVDTKDRSKDGQYQAQTKALSQKELNGDKKYAMAGVQIPFQIAKEKEVIDKGDTKHNTVTQIQAKTNTQDHKDAKLNVEVKSAIAEKRLSDTNENDDNNITTWLENKISQDMKNTFVTQNKKKRKLNPKEKLGSTKNQTSTAKQNHDGIIRMWVVNKGDTRTNTVVQNQPKINPEDTIGGKPKTMDNMNTQSVNAKCQPNEPNKTSTQAASVGNNNTPAKEKQDNKTKMMLKGDPRTINQPKTNPQDTKDCKPKTMDNMNTQNVNAKCQPNEPNKTSTQAASVGNNNTPAKEKQDSKTKIMLKGDPRTINQPKTNPQDTKDCKPKTMDNMNTQNVNAKCQPNEPNKTSTQAASVGNNNTPAKEKQDNKTKIMLKGDPRTINQPETNPQDTKDCKPKTVNNINSQNVNAKCQPNVPNKYNPQAKVKNLASGLAHKSLAEVDSLARKLEYRMKEYFGIKYWVTDLIHSGAFSTMYRCKDGSGVSKTVKLIKESWQIGAHKEAMIMKLQKGVPESNYTCVRHGHGFTMSGHWCYVMEYFPYNLQEAMNINNKSFHIDNVQEFSRQLVAAVTILRNNNIIHSDINPTHILINDTETRIKLCGFDRAFYYNGGDLLPNVGTVNYRAPELILGFHADYSIDVWATALVMYEMAANRQLFPGYYNNDILYKQFCTLASFPYEMLERCYYRNHHFMGDAFVRIVGSKGEGKVLVRDFFKKERIHSVLSQVYLAEWATLGANRLQDKGKLNALGDLLNKMLVMDPRNRIAIEFVFADRFIFERF